MTNQTDDLANVALKVIAILAFNEWDSTTYADIADAIANQDIDLDDKEEIRALCSRHGVETSDHGDNAPAVSFGHTPQIDQNVISAAVRRLHDATKSGHADDEQKASAGLNALLAQAVGMRLK